jgi:hypothetical protein
MAVQAQFTCDQHPDAGACPDKVVDYLPKFNEYGLLIHDGEDGFASSHLVIEMRGSTHLRRGVTSPKMSFLPSSPTTMVARRSTTERRTTEARATTRGVELGNSSTACTCVTATHRATRF